MRLVFVMVSKRIDKVYELGVLGLGRDCDWCISWFMVTKSC
jgi:hypothetical protein